MSEEIDNGTRAVTEARRPRRMLTEQQIVIRIALLADTIKRDLDALHKLGAITRETQLRADTSISDATGALAGITKR